MIFVCLFYFRIINTEFIWQILENKEVVDD